MSPLRSQNGSVFIISLVMLVLLTLISVSAIQTTGGMVQIVGNAQFREEGIAAAQHGIDQLVGSVTGSVSITTRAQQMNAAATNIDVNGDGQGDYLVSFAPLPVCVSRTNAKTFVDQQIILERNIAFANAPNPAHTEEEAEVAAALFKDARDRLKGLNTCTSSSGDVQCYWSLWRVSATVTDQFTGVNAAVSQGIRVLIGLDDIVNNCT